MRLQPFCVIWQHIIGAILHHLLICAIFFWLSVKTRLETDFNKSKFSIATFPRWPFLNTLLEYDEFWTAAALIRRGRNWISRRKWWSCIWKVPAERPQRSPVQEKRSILVTFYFFCSHHVYLEFFMLLLFKTTSQRWRWIAQISRVHTSMFDVSSLCSGDLLLILCT